MPSAVIDLDLAALPETISIDERYGSTFILIRYKRKPVGKLIVPRSTHELKTAHILPELLKASNSHLEKACLLDYLQWDESDVADPVKIKATVAICTRNRTEDLKDCLDWMMQLKDIGQEYLVVDNCPSDNDTEELVKKYPRVNYVREMRPGLNIARNTALQQAAGDIVVFADDDTRPDEYWLHHIMKNFQDTRVMCVTGITMPLELETDAQEAFERYNPFSKGFERKVYDKYHNPIQVGNIGAGASMAIRKKAYELIGPFDPALDAGTPTESGGDHEYFARILLNGYNIVYDPAALNWHRHRRSWKEAEKAVRGYGIGLYAYWTRLLFVEKQTAVMKLSIKWLIEGQLPMLYRSLFKRTGAQPLRLVLAEFIGCSLGPWKYFQSLRRVKYSSHEDQ